MYPLKQIASLVHRSCSSILPIYKPPLVRSVIALEDFKFSFSQGILDILIFKNGLESVSSPEAPVDIFKNDISELIEAYRTGNEMKSLIEEARQFVEKDVKSQAIYQPLLTKFNSMFGKTVKFGLGGILDENCLGILTVGVAKGCKKVSGVDVEAGHISFVSLEELSGKQLLGISDRVQLQKEVEAILSRKVYQVYVKFGESRDTADSLGVVTETKDYAHITQEMIENLLKEKYTGSILQVPPLYSNKKLNGKRWSQYARDSEADLVIREPIPVVVHSCKLTQFQLPDCVLTVDCMRGTYMRAIVTDLAEALDSCAYMSSLIRQQDGIFHIDDCVCPENKNGFLLYHLHDILTALFRKNIRRLYSFHQDDLIQKLTSKRFQDVRSGNAEDFRSRMYQSRPNVASSHRD